MTNLLPNGDVFHNQAQVFIHLKLIDDLAYRYSIQHSDVTNMRMVLRAHGESFDYESAEIQVKIGQQIGFETADN